MEGNEGARFEEREGNEWPVNLFVFFSLVDIKRKFAY